MRKPVCCVHCGKELHYGERFINAWLGTFECFPLCPEGLRWREENTIEVKGIRYLNKDWERIRPKGEDDVKPA
jgi:hypothetical protein